MPYSPPSLHSRALSPCMPLVRCRRPTPSRPWPTPRPASYALLSTRQGATAFNQPLSFDTSSVTDMSYMFYVRSAHALAHPAFTAGPSRRAYRSCAAAGQRLPASGPHLAPHRTPLLSTRQYALAFNQPLSFDTSSVTTMNQMFSVRSAHALDPQPPQPDPLAVHAARALPPAHAFPPPSRHLAPHRTPSFRLGSPRSCSTSR